MAKRLNDKQKKKIVVDYLNTESYNETARLNGVSRNTVKNIIQQTPDIAAKCQQKKEQNTQEIIAYMESQRGIVCEIIGKGLNVLNSEEKLADATPAQITTALGTLIDKFTMFQSNAVQDASIDPLSQSLKEFAEELFSDNL